MITDEKVAELETAAKGMRWLDSKATVVTPNELLGLIARLHAAEAIVAKLPKSADGVPVTLAMNLYISWKSLGMAEAEGIARGGFISLTNEGHAGEDEFSGIFMTENGDEFECIEPSQCHSTEAAARAARAGPAPSPGEAKEL